MTDEPEPVVTYNIRTTTVEDVLIELQRQQRGDT